MAKSIGLFLILTALAGCTSMQTNVPDYAQNCDGKPWSWCAGYHGDH